MEENKIRCSKGFTEATKEIMDRADEQGWDIDVDGDRQMVFFSKEVK